MTILEGEGYFNPMQNMLKIYVKHTKSLCKTKKNCFSDRSYRNRKSHEIWGHLEAILGVLGLIYVSNRVKLKMAKMSINFDIHMFITQRFLAVA